MNKAALIFKGFDVFGQLFCIFAPMFLAIYLRSADALFLILVYLGVWQLLSFFIHLLFLKKPWTTTTRKVYCIFLGSIALAGLLVPISNDAVFMSFFAAVLGIYYLIISIVEWENMKAITTPTIVKTTDGAAMV